MDVKRRWKWVRVGVDEVETCWVVMVLLRWGWGGMLSADDGRP